jgi:hypothetical protein
VGAIVAAMIPKSTAAQTLASLSTDARRRRSVEVKRIVGAYRTLRPDLPGADDIALLHHLADELEADLVEQPSAS